MKAVCHFPTLKSTLVVLIHKSYFFTSSVEHSTPHSIAGVVLGLIVSGGEMFQVVVVLNLGSDDRVSLNIAVGDLSLSHPIPI